MVARNGVRETGPVSCEVELESGVCCKCHFDHVRSHQEETKTCDSPESEVNESRNLGTGTGDEFGAETV